MEALLQMEEYKDKNWLQDKINTIGYKEDIGKLCNVSGDTIEYWRKKFNIKQVIMPSKNKKYKCDVTFFNNIDTEEKAYWLGFLMADGYMNKEKNRFGIMLKKDDINHLIKFNKSLKSTYPIKTKQYNDKRGFISKSCFIRINSSYMYNKLLKNNIYPKKTGLENIPNNIPYVLLRHFIRGFFDGDGSISKINNSKYYRFGLGSCSETIIRQIKEYIDNLFDCNISYYISYSYSMPFYYFTCNNSSLCNNFLHLLYDNSNVYLDRKKELASAMFSVCAH